MTKQNARDLLIDKVYLGEIDALNLIRNLMDQMDHYSVRSVVENDYPEYIDELAPFVDEE